MTIVAPTLESDVGACLRALESEGLTRLPNLMDAEQLRGMQTAFDSRLRHMRFNDVDGYERTEPLRQMVQDVLVLDQGFVDLALHPLVKEILSSYIGEDFSLCEAKGWRSLATMKNFHGWHGDAWYDQSQVDWIPREVKLAIYLTDVKSGAFHYVRGSHRKQRPRTVRQEELTDVPKDDIIEMLGPAGTAFLFDTSGIHRQGMPILEPRQAVFLNYHQPSIPLQQEDVEYYRYHPLILNAAFLGNLSERDTRILGFGDKTHYRPAFVRDAKFGSLQSSIRRLFETRLHADAVLQTWIPRFKRLLGK
jgi:Phytanoyl-CoA dioxygenase (PhyH)